MTRDDFINDDVLREILYVCLNRDYHYMSIDVIYCIDVETNKPQYQLRYCLFVDAPAPTKNETSDDELTWDISDAGYQRWERDLSDRDLPVGYRMSYWETFMERYIDMTPESKATLRKINQSLVWTLQELFEDA